MKISYAIPVCNEYKEIEYLLQYLTKHKIAKSDFELLCLAVAVIVGCGKCINAHEAVLRENNISIQSIQTVARIASIINSIANIMRVMK